MRKWDGLSFEKKQVEIEHLVTSAYHRFDGSDPCDRIEEAIAKYIRSTGIEYYNVRVIREKTWFIDGYGYPEVSFLVSVVILKEENVEDVFYSVRPVYA